MGWDFCEAWRERRDAVENTIRATAVSHPKEGFDVNTAGPDDWHHGRQECLAHALRGNHLWTIERATYEGHPELDHQEVALYLLARNKEGWWGTKSLDETCYPYYYDCPLELLDRCPDPREGQSTAWREAVRAHAAARRERARVAKHIEPGQTWKLAAGLHGSQSGATLTKATIIRKSERGRGWIAEADEDGQRYKFQTRHFVELVEASSKVEPEATPGPIVATIVPDDRRMAFLPHHVHGGALKVIAVETKFYNVAGRISRDYHGGFWNFHEVSNGAWFISPKADSPFHVAVDGNFFTGDLKPETFGLVTSLMAMSELSFDYESDDTIAENFHKLRDYAASLPDSSDIFAAID